MNNTNKQKNSFPRGRSLEKDFRQLITDERFYDITLECSDGVTISGCKAILATRSDIFNKRIFTKSGANDKLLFNDIDSTAMEIILKFLYTSKAENLTDNNVVEAYYASIYFELVVLQDNILEFTKKSLKLSESSQMSLNENVGKKLLSACVKKFTLRVNNKMSQILVEFVAKNKLEKNEIDLLSLDGLRYLLEKTQYSQIPFATPEFTIWEYALRKAIREVTQNKPLIERILNKKSLSVCNPREAEEIKSHLTLIHYIDLNRMDADEIKLHVEPFSIFSLDRVTDAYRSKALGEELGFIRGVPIFKWVKGKELSTSNDRFTIEAIGVQQHTSIFGDLIFKGKGIYEWDILIEKLCGIVYIGICDLDEDLSKTDQKYHGWVLGSDGYVYHKRDWKWYDARFKEGDKVTVHLDLKLKTCEFSINKIKKPIISEWKNIPSKVFPIVSLENGNKLRIEPRM